MVHRIAVLDRERCQPKKCGLECYKLCPGVKMGDKTIIFGEDEKPIISEELCTGCSICIKKCPFNSIIIINLAEELKEDKIHQYGLNGFRLYRLPIPRRGVIVGLVGKNGTGKTTALNILSGNIRPNMGMMDNPSDWDMIINHFQGTELKDHFEKIYRKELRVSFKPQTVYQLAKVWKSDALSLLKMFDEEGKMDELVEQLNLKESLHKLVKELSGGELQRLAVALCASKMADIYFFDEPSSYNDVFQRLRVAKVISSLAKQGKSVLVVEHDLTVLDYLSDYVHILYGDPGAYGIVSGVMSARVGINTLLDGYLPAENVRFRDKPIIFDVYAPISDSLQTPNKIEYSDLLKSYPGFKLKVSGGSLREGEILGILGGNALGKTTFMKIIAGEEKTDEGDVKCKAKISYKPQYLNAEFDGDVKSLLDRVSEDNLNTGLIQSLIINPLRIHKLYDRQVKDLSGGELQKVAVTECLLREADVYALDEPSAFMDVEDRVAFAKAVQRFVKAQGKSAMIVDHDVQLIDIVSDSLMIFTGEQGVKGEATSPMEKEEGMNIFLKDLGITYRRDIDTGRPRVNKPDSKLDREQKERGSYYYLSKRA
ncbi:MAG: ribosome biogenesis/translation initiation ATPase RLI [archaeon]|nr:ribosome biogenesis/translation initiation ATPase RLI [archaeon]MCP8314727.1 ribosome biogenesis/translation initiation ATPase RLI [archaeon]MCP8316093.1 ribosome biogenesis/translation initiation ATPase RLI [archaeon]MCP8319890.1 ribosome biogenesis/translation initiation ATPase RLI [archaeon]